MALKPKIVNEVSRKALELPISMEASPEKAKSFNL